MTLLNDYKELIRTNGELDYKSDAGQSYEEIYELSGYIDYLQKLCNKYGVSFDKNNIDKDYYTYVQIKTYEIENLLEKKIKFDIKIIEEKNKKVYKYFSNYLNEIRDEIDYELYIEMYNMLQKIKN